MLVSQRFISGFLWVAAFGCLSVLMVNPGDANRDTLFYSKPEYRPFLEDWKKLGQGDLTDLDTDPHLLWAQSETIGEMISARLDPELWTKDRIQDLSQFILLKSREYKVPPLLVISLIEVESNFKPGAISPRGAVGLMQLMPATAEALAIQGDQWQGGLADPKRNIEYGLRYMRKLQSKFRRPEHVLTAYNMGPAALQRKLRNGETVRFDYYDKVMGIMQNYKRRSPVMRSRKTTWL